MKKNNEYMKYPTTVVVLAEEIKHICNDYNARKISNQLFEETIIYYAKSFPEMLFNGPDLNKSIMKIVGKNRCIQINKVLAG